MSLSPTLGRGNRLSEVIGTEVTSQHYSSHLPMDHINYKSIMFSLSKVILEDSWLVKFMPSKALMITFIKYRNYF